MRVLLDTHALLWMLSDGPELSPQARIVAADLSNELLFSIGSAWEIAVKHSLGELDLRMPYRPFIEGAIRAARLTLLPISIEHLARITALPQHHRDPFDRLLIAQALVEGVPILSRDERLESYEVKRIW